MQTHTDSNGYPALHTAPQRRTPLAERPGALALSDALIVTTSLVVSATVAGLSSLLTFASLLPLALLVGWLIALGLGRSRDARILGSGTAEFRRLAVSTLSFAGSAALLLSVFGLDLATGHFVLSLVLGLFLLLASRVVWRVLLVRGRKRGVGLKRVVVAGENAAPIARHLAGAPVSGLHPVALVAGAIDADEVVGTALASRAEAVVLTGDIGEPRDAQHLVWTLQGHGVEVIVSTDLIDVAPERLGYRHADGLPLAHIKPRPTRGVGHGLKAVVDRVGAAIGLLLLAPVLAVVALAVRTQDGGPALFFQSRVGKDGKQFRLVKFRTMCVDAEDRQDQLTDQNDGSGPLFKLHRDPRVTRIGGILRKYSLDELPQLWNVLAGDMSLIGPRPALPHEVAAYPAHATRRLLVKPGMTGLWQVSGRSDLDFTTGLRLDLAYVDNWAPRRDLSIIARTVGVVVRPRGAY